MNEQLRRFKARANELEGKISDTANNDGKINEYIQTLNDKYNKLKAETDSLKRMTPVPEKSDPAAAAQKKPQKDAEELKAMLRSSKTTVEKERISNKKEVEGPTNELNELKKKLKEREQENRLNALKLKELSRVIKQVPEKTEYQRLPKGINRKSASTVKKRIANKTVALPKANDTNPSTSVLSLYSSHYFQQF